MKNMPWGIELMTMLIPIPGQPAVLAGIS